MSLLLFAIFEDCGKVCNKNDVLFYLGLCVSHLFHVCLRVLGILLFYCLEGYRWGPVLQFSWSVANPVPAPFAYFYFHGMLAHLFPGIFITNGVWLVYLCYFLRCLLSLCLMSAFTMLCQMRFIDDKQLYISWACWADDRDTGMHSRHIA